MARRRNPTDPLLRSAPCVARVVLRVGCAGAPPPSSAPATSDPPAAPPIVDEGTALGALLGPWRPEPIPLWPALLAEVATDCAGSMQPFPAIPLVAVDARGGGRLQALFAGAGQSAACYDMTIDARGAVGAMGGGMTSMGDVQPPIGAQALRSAGLSTSREGVAGDVVTSSVISGEAGAGVATVVVVMPGQARMRATIANGWYLFWWPGAIPAETKVIGLDGFGQHVATSDP
jgi:hypothetical protein